MSNPIGSPLTPALALLHTTARRLALAHQGRLRCEPAGELSTALPPLSPSRGQPATAVPDAEAAAHWRAWLLQHTPLLACHQTLFALTPRATSWLHAPPPLQLTPLRLAWWRNPTPPAGLWPAYRGKVSRRTQAVVLTLCQALAAAPRPQPVSLAAMLTDLATAGLFKPQGHVRNLSAVAAALTQHYRHVAQFVMLHILPALGLAMLYRATDHWELALTSEGHTWLRGALRRKALWDAPPADAAVELSVPEPDQPWPSPSADFPPLVVTTAPEGPAIVCRYPATAPAVLTYHLAHIATPVVWPPLHAAMTQWAAQYRLTAASMARAAAWGYTPAQIIALLGQFSGGEIPPAALGHLRTWQRTTTTCTAESGYYLGMPPGTLEALHPRKAFRQRVRLVGGTQRLDRFTPQGAWVAQAQIDTLIIEHLEFIIEDHVPRITFHASNSLVILRSLRL